MRDRRRILAVTVAGIVVLGGLVVVGTRLWERAHRTDLEAAVAVVPRASVRMAFTDWSAVRERLGVATTGVPTAEEIEKLTEGGYDADLTAVSSIDEATAALQENFGFSPTTMEWEAFAQARGGATMVARMPDDFDFDKVRDNLEDLGFKKPAKEDGVWDGGIDLVAGIDPTITPELQYVSLLEDEHLIVTSDDIEYAATAAAVARGDKPSLGDVASARDLAERSGEPAAAMFWPRDFACTDLSMSAADEDSQDQATALIAAAGKTTPLDGLTMALEPDRTMRVVLHFESEDQAEDNLRARAKLAVGEAVGRGGSFDEDLELVTSRTEGSTVQLTFEPREKSGFVLSALDSGPVIFATC